ncbi:hypothetical protein MCUN1_003910 [Malassezia cuniculi]|uniref:NAD(P)-binding domain-containing protein n=1 Tax=Malassezia cuniculi TaxID=948313 RepID=A0AAF0J878_9BASI|nr:hypothetical protein MCUN1_003910 [Malassezia cuniculi]
MKRESSNSNMTIQAGALKGQKIRAFVCGHTGATGKELMDILVASDSVESIVAVGRRKNEKYENHEKVKQYVVCNMVELGKEDIAIAQGCNAAFCAIGTAFMDVLMMNKESYRNVDFGIATEFAKFARKAGAEYLSVITGEGTDTNTSMYMYKVKHDVENFIQTLGFERIAIMRPGFLHRGKDASWMEFLMLSSFFGTPVVKVAAAMYWAALHQKDSVHGYTTKEIKENATALGK